MSTLPGAGPRAGLRTDLRRDLHLYSRTALPAGCSTSPMNGATGAVMLFMAAYLAACIAMGIAVSTLFATAKTRCCCCCHLDSGAHAQRCVVPAAGHSRLLFNLGQLFPSSHGVNGFIRIQTMGLRSPRYSPRSNGSSFSRSFTADWPASAFTGDRPRTARTPRKKEKTNEGC